MEIPYRRRKEEIDQKQAYSKPERAKALFKCCSHKEADHSHPKGKENICALSFVFPCLIADFIEKT
jgi:hypothetical protein